MSVLVCLEAGEEEAGLIQAGKADMGMEEMEEIRKPTWTNTWRHPTWTTTWIPVDTTTPNTPTSTTNTTSTTTDNSKHS